MGKGGKKKVWPRSWRQAAAMGESMVLKGRGVEAEYVVLPLRVPADAPEALVELVDGALRAETGRQRPS